MKFYVRTLPQKQCHQQMSDKPILPFKREIRPNDTWCSYFASYHIDKITYSKEEITVYATKTLLTKTRKNTCYIKHKQKIND